MRGHMFLGPSRTMGFLNENDSLAYLAILGELSSSLSYCGLFKTSSFLFISKTLMF